MDFDETVDLIEFLLVLRDLKIDRREGRPEVFEIKSVARGFRGKLLDKFFMPAVIEPSKGHHRETSDPRPVRDKVICPHFGKHKYLFTGLSIGVSKFDQLLQVLGRPSGLMGRVSGSAEGSGRGTDARDLALRLNLAGRLLRGGAVAADARGLLEADEAFVTNALLGVMPLTRVNGRAIGRGAAGPITEKLRKAYLTKLQLSCPANAKSV